MYLSRRLYAQNSHPCLWIILEAVDQLDPLCRRNTAIDPDITGLQDKKTITLAPLGSRVSE